MNIYKCKPQGLCIVCNEPKADARLEVQINNFRGDDDVYKIHWKCRYKGRQIIEIKQIVDKEK